MMQQKYDLAICGGGLAGLALALQCRQRLPSLRIAILEKRAEPAPEAAFKVGESTVEVAAHYFGEILGVKEHIQEAQLPKLGLRFFFPAGDNSRIEDRLEVGATRYAPCPSYQLDRGRFENHLAELCLERGVDFIRGATVSAVNLGRFGRSHTVDFALNNATQTLKTRWIVDATGRHALLKRKLNLQKPSPHVGNAVWWRIGKPIRIDDWSDDSQWQGNHADLTARYYSTNHLMGEGYWVWLIPLASGSTSFGIVACDKLHPLTEYNSLEKAVLWLEKHEPQCADVVRTHLDDVQDFGAIKNYSVECTQVFSPQRWGITGEAGFFHDPFYSPGSDFIALANTFLTELIERDVKWRGFRMRANAYDKIFKKFFYGTAAVYQDQYPLFGNPAVMPAKITWDYLIYWTITGLFFMQGQLCRQRAYLRSFRQLNELGKLNHYMQEFFREWHERTADAQATGYVDVASVEIVREWNRQLTEDLSSRDFGRRFADRVEELKRMGREIVAHSGVETDYQFSDKNGNTSASNALEKIFSPVLRSPPIEDLSPTAP